MLFALDCCGGRRGEVFPTLYRRHSYGVCRRLSYTLCVRTCSLCAAIVPSEPSTFSSPMCCTIHAVERIVHGWQNMLEITSTWNVATLMLCVCFELHQRTIWFVGLSPPFVMLSAQCVHTHVVFYSAISMDMSLSLSLSSILSAHACGICVRFFVSELVWCVIRYWRITKQKTSIPVLMTTAIFMLRRNGQTGP